jgi:FkbM family methyltransferase
MEATPARAFRRKMIESCIAALKLNTLTDNYDSERFGHDGVDRSRQFRTGERGFWFDWFYENFEAIYRTIELMRDEPSKNLMRMIIAYRLAGHHSVRIPVEFRESGEEWERYKSIEKYVNSALSTTGIFGNLRHYDFIFNGEHYVCDCLGLKYYLFRKQYFFKRDTVAIQPEAGDFVIDAGACLGDTAVIFGKAVGENGRVYAFDPVQEHLDTIRINASQNPDCHIISMPYGLSDQDLECPPIVLSTYAPGFNASKAKVPLRALDSILMEGGIPRVDFIKMDIEGSELGALKGAVGTIRKYRPKLAISLYHKPNDIFEIPQFISEHFSNYEFFLGHYTIHNEETVLYCRSLESE